MIRLTLYWILAVILGQTCILSRAESPISKRQASGPNVVLIMTDDQDLVLDSLSVQPNVRSLVGGKGVTYNNFYCTVAWCCPSRVNFFTGRAAHNTNVTSLSKPYGGWQKFSENGLNNDWLPVWLQEAGVKTYYAGKLMNGFTTADLATPAPPAGWTNSSFLVDPYTYDYLDSLWTNTTNAKRGEWDRFTGIHTSVVLQEKGLAMLEQAAASGQQFYLQLAPVAPHQNGGPAEADSEVSDTLTERSRGSFVASAYPPIPPGYHGVFSNRTVPVTSNFNPEVSSGVSWISTLPRLNHTEVSEGNMLYYHRLANLAYVDDIVGNIVSKLDDLGILDNTYIVYTTDNGFHIGQHRLPPGKRCPYEEDINIPLLIRGPDVAQNVSTSYVSSHTDMAPTILQMLGVPQRDNFDGQPIPYTPAALSDTSNAELVNVEFWNSNANITNKQAVKGVGYYNNTYKALRFVGEDYSFMYSTWCDGSHEFYDMQTDSQQMFNRLANPPLGSPSKYYGRNETELFTRLNALLMVTKSCAGDACRKPWSVLFPDGQVTDLPRAMASQYDAFFASQPQVSFDYCIPGNIVELQGPQSVNPYSGNS